MDRDTFDPIVFMKAGESAALRDATVFPFLYNDRGRGVQLVEPRGALIPTAPENPDLDLGIKYFDIKSSAKVVTPASGAPYEIVSFDFGVDEVHYAPLPATRETVRAFGMTLLRSGECVRFQYEGLVMTDYTYGKWVAYQSSYLGPERERELLTYNPTNLEFHDFAHVFFSRDEVPLVISVARFRPYVRQISLADLWIAPGDAIVLPPKVRPAPPPHGASYDEARRVVLDLHSNRNSALACRFREGKLTLSTTTILANAKVFEAEATRPRFHEEQTPTRHLRLREERW